MIDERLKTVRMRPATCPGCRATITAASSAGGWHPAPGDLTVCLYCATALAFTASLELRLATDADLDGLDAGALARLLWFQQCVLDASGRRAGRPS